MIPVVVVVVGVETTFKPMYGFGTIRRKNISTCNMPMYALLQLKSITVFYFFIILMLMYGFDVHVCSLKRGSLFKWKL